MATARREFAEGDHTAAINRLKSLEATHPIVAATLAELRTEAAAVQRRIQTGTDGPSWSGSSVAEKLAAVRAAIAEDRWDEAASRIQTLQ